MSKDYELVLTIKNAPLLNRMREYGYENAAELSRASGVSQIEIGRFLNLKVPAYRGNGGGFRSGVLKLAEFFSVIPEELFPTEHLRDALKENEFRAQVTLQEMELISNSHTKDPSEVLEYMETETRDSFMDMIGGLTRREQEVITMRYREGKEYKEIGEIQGVSGTRITQICDKALRKLRHPARRRGLVSASGIYGAHHDLP